MHAVLPLLWGGFVLALFGAMEGGVRGLDFSGGFAAIRLGEWMGLSGIDNGCSEMNGGGSALGDS